MVTLKAGHPLPATLHCDLMLRLWCVAPIIYWGVVWVLTVAPWLFSPEMSPNPCRVPTSPTTWACPAASSAPPHRSSHVGMNSPSWRDSSRSLRARTVDRSDQQKRKASPYVIAGSLIAVLSEPPHMSLEAASFCLQPSEGEGGCDRLAGAGPGGVLLGPGRPPKLPPTPKPGNENFPLLPPPGPRRWGRLSSARREEASSSIVLHGPRLQEEATWSQGPFLLTRPLTTGAEQASWGKWPQVSAALASP